MALSHSYAASSWPECSHGPCTLRRSKDKWAFYCNGGKENHCKTVHFLDGPPSGVPPTCLKHGKRVKGAVQVQKGGKVYRVYRCEAAEKGMAYCGKSTVASVPAAVADQEVSVVHQAQPRGAVDIAPTECKPRDPCLLTDSDQKPPAEHNQPSKSTTHPANPEDARETTEQNSSLESFGSSDEVNDAPPTPEECHTPPSMPADSEGETLSSETNNSSVDSGGSPSEGYRDLPKQEEHDKQQLDDLTLPDECNTTDTSSSEPQTQLDQSPLDSSSSPHTEWEERTGGPMTVVREGCVSLDHSSGSADSSYSEEEEEEEEERYRPKPNAPRQAVLISPQPIKPSVLGARQGCLAGEKDSGSAFKIARTYVKLERQLAATDELLLRAAGLPDGGAELRQFRKAIIDKMTSMKNPVTKPSKEVSEERLLKAQRAVMMSQAKALTQGAVVQIHKSLEGLPAPDEMASEPAGLKVSLFPHQRHALAWLQWREQQKPSGGILADEMGLGKTLTMISLVLRDLPVEGKWRAGGSASQGLLHSSATLVVCPKSLMLQWEAEIGRRVERGTLRTYVYHGSGRATDPRVLASYDIVLTTYGLVASEWQATLEESTGRRKASAHPLFSVHWNRVALDEAHIIRNPATSVSQGAATLSADHRWCITGTPIQNKQQDLYALVRFLHLAPFDDKNVWRQQVEKGQRGVERMNAVVQGLVLRRLKSDLGINGKELVSLPAKHVALHELALSEVEQALHDAIFRQSRADFVRWLQKTRGESTEEPPEASEPQPPSELQCSLLEVLKARKVMGSAGEDAGYSNLLLHLLRLRQACVHPHLVMSLRGDMAVGGEEDLDGLSSQLGGLSLGSGGSDAALLEGECSPVPTQPFMGVFQSSFVSTRMKAVLEAIVSLRPSGDKSVVFSQWTAMLDIVEFHLQQSGISFSRIDGTSSAKVRQAIVDSFNSSSPRPKVLTVSLTAGGVGLNLTGGNHIFLLDLHWNPFQEGQAMDRVHRMGQTKEVYVHRFFCRSSIEERILQLQEKKRGMAENVLSGTGAKGASKLSLADLKLLFQVGEGE